MNLMIGKSYDGQIVSFKDFRAEIIFLFALCRIVLRTVDLYDESRLVTIKVCNEVVDGFLALKSYFVC